MLCTGRQLRFLDNSPLEADIDREPEKASIPQMRPAPVPVRLIYPPADRPRLEPRLVGFLCCTPGIMFQRLLHNDITFKQSSLSFIQI